MRFEGKVYNDGNFWLAEIPLLDLMTQGRTKKEALQMVVDLLKTAVNKKGFRVIMSPTPENRFEISGNDDKVLIALLLQRQRQKHGLSLRQAAARLSSRSPEAFARYEKGRSTPTLEKLVELLKAIDPRGELVLSWAR